MKKIIYSFLFIALAFVLFPGFSHAQTGVAPMKNNYAGKKIDPPGVRPTNMMEKAQNIKDTAFDDRVRLAPDLEKRREFEMTKDGQIRAKDGQPVGRREKIGKHVEIITARLNAGVMRLEQIITRIESRNEKIKSEGGDVSASEKAITSAQTEIEKAKTDISSLSTMFESVVEESDLSTTEGAAAISAIKATQQANKDALMKMRATIQSAKGHLESARKYLVNSVTVIKSMRSTSPTSATPVESI